LLGTPDIDPLFQSALPRGERPQVLADNGISGSFQSALPRDEIHCSVIDRRVRSEREAEPAFLRRARRGVDGCADVLRYLDRCGADAARAAVNEKFFTGL
jgi:hypothetical protein